MEMVRFALIHTFPFSQGGVLVFEYRVLHYTVVAVNLGDLSLAATQCVIAKGKYRTI